MGLATFYLLNRWEMPPDQGSLTSILPVLRPWNSPIKACDMLANPSLTVSSAWRVPASKAGMASARNAP